MSDSSLLSKIKGGIPLLENLKSNITDGAIRLKDLGADDINDLFIWRNHPDVRKNSFNSKPISWQEPKKWFSDKLQDQKVAIYIAFDEKNKIGSIRFENKDNAIKVSVMLNPDFIGEGFGSKLIKVGTEKFINKKKSINL